ncbi:MAG: glucoamylase family protein [Terriglobales bacterium]
MPQNPQTETLHHEKEAQSGRPPESAEFDRLRSSASGLSRNLPWNPAVKSSDWIVGERRTLNAALAPVLAALHQPVPKTELSDDLRWLHDNVRLLYTESHATADAVQPLTKIPHVYTAGGETVPRAAAVARGFLVAASYEFSESAFAAYLEVFQENVVLNVKELWALVACMKLALLEEIAVRGKRALAGKDSRHDVGLCIRSLRDITETSWKEIIEPLIVFDGVLRDDPAGAYSGMDFESRELYRKTIVEIAERCDFTEMEVAQEALALAREAGSQPLRTSRMELRKSHIGYYLISEGRSVLNEKVRFKPSLGRRIQDFLLRHPDEYYIPTIAILCCVIMSAIVLLLTDPNSSPILIFLALLALFLPSSQSAVELVNYLTTSLLRAEILPKMDFSEGIPDDCMTLVAVPTLLLSEEQVRRLVDDLEVRFLGNHDRNLHFVLLSDLPDSRQPSREDDPLIDLCAELIERLNDKYAHQGEGSFLLLHRHRIYNPREGVWMGWERKRGKLLDLNKLLRRQYDSFPVKAGDLSVLPNARYVITLDSDTELPRGAAHRMAGTLAHPLNQAIIDPDRNIVTAGYGILQPRVGVSVQSAAASRLANIYSGQTGFDIYTRAVSDIYQDLCGEGSFAGKGIYEVDTVHQVLDRRFPRNALLSHDLIEGAYARAGLVSDIEVIEDYPSHYSAHNRRKHRWLRGDWQITQWLLSRVPDESGKLVRNPISLVSQWKIFDNLRRSLVEPATFLLFVLCWLVLPGRPVFWTLATLAILFAPTWFRFVFQLIRAAAERKSQVARDAVESLFSGNVGVFLTLTFLAHQMLVAFDAVVRTLIRRMVTGQRLLEWETAAEAELGKKKRTPVDVYMDWVPPLALALGVILWFSKRNGFYAALPILVLWAGSKFISTWLNRPHHTSRGEASQRDDSFLRRAAIRTWRYFAEFSTEEHNWLIPDNLQENPPTIAARVSPTNLGFLLNARQVACEFGYLTVAEFAEETLRTFSTAERLEKHRGHLLNWYDTRTLAPLPPAFVSSVDSGNLVASLWTLQQGSLDMLKRPILQPALAEGLVDYLRILADLRAFPRKRINRFRGEIRSNEDWLQAVLNFPESSLDDPPEGPKSKREGDAQWFRGEARKRLLSIQETVRLSAPWLLPEFASLRSDTAINARTGWDILALERVPNFIDALAARLEAALGSGTDKSSATNKSLATDKNQETLYRGLLARLPEARWHAGGLIADLLRISDFAAEMANRMDFKFLLHPKRKLLSVGFEVEKKELNSACYDLLASESCIALFTAIAKDDIPQESWFLLGRAHVVDHGHPVLLSWTGTMFEYLMPSLWMRTFPDTLLQRSRAASVGAQQAFTASRDAPWGISEAAYSLTDETGNYQYYAFGIPALALRKGELNSLVISPYSTFLALNVEADAALRNLRRMAQLRWVGPYGFYESVDFDPVQRPRSTWRSLSGKARPEVVRCWMAHHQGMTLLAIANFLRHDVVQQWFHSEPRVQATELLLHEKPVSHVRAADGYGTAAA